VQGRPTHLAVLAVARAELLAGDVEGAVDTLAHKEALPAGTDEDLAADKGVHLNLIRLVRQGDRTVGQALEVERLPVDLARLLHLHRGRGVSGVRAVGG